VSVRGTLRVCTKIVDEGRKHTIEINEQGVPVTREDGELLLQKIKEVAKRCAFLTLSGSLPKGLSKDFYARAVRAIKQCAPTCRVVVDAEGELLLQALAEAPFLIKPNIHELEGTFGCRIQGVQELDAIAQEILTRYGLGAICVSLGAKGAYIATRSEAYCCEPALVEVRSLQGAGDAMVAGLCLALERGLPLDKVLHYGVAMAGAAISTEGTRPGTKEDFERLLSTGVKMKKVR
jgi:1-phosphofructokinase